MLLRELLTEKWSQKYKSSINCANPKGFSQKAHCAGRKKEEDYDPNDTPPGPETKPTMPQGSVRVDVSDVYDWYKLGKNFPNLKNIDKGQFGKGPPSTIVSFGSEEEEHKYIKDLLKLGLTTTDIDPPSNIKGPRQKVDPTYNVGENFADGKNLGRKGLAKRSGVNTKASVSSLRNTAKHSTGEKARMAHWLANMKSGRKKANEDIGEHEVMKAFRDFLPIAMHVLKIDKLPHIKLTKIVDDSDQPTFGRFINDNMIIEVGIANRHILDILRTLAHELTHFKQFINHRIGPHSGNTGSPEENEAHAVAGVIMRFFNKKHPHYFKDVPLQMQETATAGATSAGMVSVGPVYKNKKAKQIKNPDGTAKNALDIAGGNLLTGMTVTKR